MDYFLKTTFILELEANRSRFDRCVTRIESKFSNSEIKKHDAVFASDWISPDLRVLKMWQIRQLKIEADRNQRVQRHEIDFFYA
jgi:hypothetical protein